MVADWEDAGQINALQRLEDARFHRWYRFVLAYSDKLVTNLIGRYDVGPDSVLLDPFCGTGTTLIAAKAAGITSIGVDSNPVAVFASRAKTNWSVDPAELQSSLRRIGRRFSRFNHVFDPEQRPPKRLVDDLRQYLAASPVSERVEYFETSGMLDRQWMFELPMLQSFALMHIIETTQADPAVIDLLRLLMAAAAQERVANIGFGPELYVKKAKLAQTKDALGALMAKASDAAADLREAPHSFPASDAYLADSRQLETTVQRESVSHVITSPPYPTEKDYTRNSRLELVLLGFVRDTSSLRDVKKEMIRSHSKGIYNTDDDSAFVGDIESVQRVAAELAGKAATKTYGFAKLYPKIITEYFGGMRRHLRSMRPLLRDGGLAAYVVGEQTCYLQTFTPTATILGEIAVLEGYEVKEVLPFRLRTGTTGGGRVIKEEVLVLRAT